MHSNSLLNKANKIQIHNCFLKIAMTKSPANLKLKIKFQFCLVCLININSKLAFFNLFIKIKPNF